MFKVCCQKNIAIINKIMKNYCLSCRKHTGNIGSKKSNNGK